ncbi:MAG TPA: lactate utilization protein [Hanamia sp.]
MKVSSSKEKILKKIREALSDPAPLPFPKSEGSNSVFKSEPKELEVLFAEEFAKLMGRFAFCVNETDAKNQIQNLITQKKWKHIYCLENQLKSLFTDKDSTDWNHPSLSDCDASVTSCHYLVARTGAIVMSSAQKSGRTTSVYAPVHICIGYVDQLVYDTRDALKSIKEKYGTKMPSLITFAVGPSRTADIEKTLVVGVHGPKEVYVFLIDR